MPRLAFCERKPIRQRRITGLLALCFRGNHRVFFESPFRPHRPKTCSPNLPCGFSRFNGPIRTLPFFSSNRPQVPPLSLHRRYVTQWSIHSSRCLHGALRGNIGVVKSAMAELTDESNAPRGFSLLHMTWSIGFIIGSVTIYIYYVLSSLTY